MNNKNSSNNNFLSKILLSKKKSSNQCLAESHLINKVAAIRSRSMRSYPDNNSSRSIMVNNNGRPKNQHEKIILRRISHVAHQENLEEFEFKKSISIDDHPHKILERTRKSNRSKSRDMTRNLTRTQSSYTPKFARNLCQNNFLVKKDQNRLELEYLERYSPLEHHQLSSHFEQSFSNQSSTITAATKNSTRFTDLSETNGSTTSIEVSEIDDGSPKSYSKSFHLSHHRYRNQANTNNHHKTKKKLLKNSCQLQLCSNIMTSPNLNCREHDNDSYNDHFSVMSSKKNIAKTNKNRRKSIIANLNKLELKTNSNDNAFFEIDVESESANTMASMNYGLQDNLNFKDFEQRNGIKLINNQNKEDSNCLSVKNGMNNELFDSLNVRQQQQQKMKYLNLKSDDDDEEEELQQQQNYENDISDVSSFSTQNSNDDEIHHIKQDDTIKIRYKTNENFLQQTEKEKHKNIDTYQDPTLNHKNFQNSSSKAFDYKQLNNLTDVTSIGHHLSEQDHSSIKNAVQTSNKIEHDNEPLVRNNINNLNKAIVMRRFRRGSRENFSNADNNNNSEDVSKINKSNSNNSSEMMTSCYLTRGIGQIQFSEQIIEHKAKDLIYTIYGFKNQDNDSNFKTIILNAASFEQILDHLSIFYLKKAQLAKNKMTNLYDINLLEIFLSTYKTFTTLEKSIDYLILRHQSVTDSEIIKKSKLKNCSSKKLEKIANSIVILLTQILLKLTDDQSSSNNNNNNKTLGLSLFDLTSKSISLAKIATFAKEKLGTSSELFLICKSLKKALQEKEKKQLLANVTKFHYKQLIENSENKKMVEIRHSISSSNSKAELLRTQSENSCIASHHNNHVSSNKISSNHHTSIQNFVDLELKLVKLSEQFNKFSVQTIASQLIRLDSKYFLDLIPSQCLGSIWSRRSNLDDGETNTVRATIEHFNQVVYAVTETILAPRSNDENTNKSSSNNSRFARAHIISKWIEIADQLHYKRNFSSLKAILSALQSFPIHRLEKTWALIPKESKMCMKYLNYLMKETYNNFIKVIGKDEQFGNSHVWILKEFDISNPEFCGSWRSLINQNWSKFRLEKIKTYQEFSVEIDKIMEKNQKSSSSSNSKDHDQKQVLSRMLSKSKLKHKSSTNNSKSDDLSINSQCPAKIIHHDADRNTTNNNNMTRSHESHEQKYQPCDLQYPIIPYLGNFLTEFMTLDTAMPDLVANDATPSDETSRNSNPNSQDQMPNLINFEKRRKEFEILMVLKILQHSAGHLKYLQCSNFDRWMDSVVCLTDQQTFELSKKAEPPQTNGIKTQNSIVENVNDRITTIFGSKQNASNLFISSNDSIISDDSGIKILNSNENSSNIISINGNTTSPIIIDDTIHEDRVFQTHNSTVVREINFEKLGLGSTISSEGTLTKSVSLDTDITPSMINMNSNLQNFMHSSGSSRPKKTQMAQPLTKNFHLIKIHFKDKYCCQIRINQNDRTKKVLENFCNKIKLEDNIFSYRDPNTGQIVQLEANERFKIMIRSNNNKNRDADNNSNSESKEKVYLPHDTNVYYALNGTETLVVEAKTNAEIKEMLKTMSSRLCKRNSIQAYKKQSPTLKFKRYSVINDYCIGDGYSYNYSPNNLESEGSSG